jgi:hypothetical protein
LFVRIFGGTSATKTEGESIFAIDPNEVDQVRGTSFAEEALAALQQHATQGPWPKTIAELVRARRIEAGKLPLIRYRLLHEAPGTPKLPENANTPVAGLKLSEPFAVAAAPPTIDGRPLTDFLGQPDRVLAALVDWRAGQTASAPGAESTANDLERFRLFETRANTALATASGITLTLTSRNPVLVPGTSTTFSIIIGNPGGYGIHLNDLRLNGWGDNVRLPAADLLLPDTETVVTLESTTPSSATLTVPQEEHLYDGLLQGKRFEARATMEMDGARFSVARAIQLEVAPAVEIRKVSPTPVVWTPGRRDQVLRFITVVRNNLATPFRGTVQLSSRALGIAAVDANLTLQPNETRSVELRSVAPTKPRIATSSAVNSSFAFMVVEDAAASVISKRTLPVIFSDARVVPRLQVGFVPSFDQTLEHALAALGVNAKALTVEDIKTSDLSNFDTIIIDNRGYEAHPELIAANSRLLDFAQTGGTLIVFYHKDNEWNPDEKKNRPQLAPYPIILDDKRITDETAPITFLQPRHPLLYFPNRITPADFANWIQERGLYYPKQWDEHYTALFASNDPGERRRAVATPFSMSRGPISRRIGTPFNSHSLNFQPADTVSRSSR